MAQLTAEAGVTLHDPVDREEGDSRTPGWGGGLAQAGYARAATNVTRTPAVVAVPRGYVLPPVTANAAAWQVNGFAALAASKLILQTQASTDAGTAWAQEEVLVDGLVVEFTSSMVGTADGITFGLRPSGSSRTSVGGGGSGCGWTGLTGAALKLNLYASSASWMNGNAAAQTKNDGALGGSHRWQLAFTKTGAGVYTVKIKKDGIDYATWAGMAVPDTAVVGFTGGAGLYRMDASVSDVLIRPRVALVDVGPYASYSLTVVGVRSIGAGTSFPRFADNIKLSALGAEVYSGYHQGITAVRTQMPVVPGQRTATGLTVRNPADTTLVQPPPTIIPLGHKNDRIRRFQKFGTQAIFFKDQGGTNTRISTARWGANRFVENGRSDSVWSRGAEAGADLADLVRAGQMESARDNDATAAADLLVVHDVAAGTAARQHAGTYKTGDNLTIFDVSGFAGRNGTGSVAPWVIYDYQDFWMEGPYEFEGGDFNIASTIGLPPPDTYEWGWYIVPAGEDMSDGDSSHYWFYSGWDGDIGDTTETGGQNPDGTQGGPYYFGTGTIYEDDTLPAGDLYLYAYGDQYDANDPSEIRPTAMPPAPPGAPSHSPIPPGPRPVVRFGADQRQPPANDRLRSFIQLQGASGELEFTTIAATLEATEPPLGIGAQGSRGTVWFSWTPNYDGEITLAAPGTALEVYKGPAPAPPLVIGVDGYRGEWDADTDYDAGDMVRYNGVLYRTTAPVTGKTPDTPDVVGGPLKAFGSVSVGSPDLPLGQRITLQPGTYYYIGDGGGGGYTTNPTMPVITGPVAQATPTGYNSDASAWANLNSYRFPFALYDSVTGTEVVRLGTFQGGSFGQDYHQYQAFVLSAPVTFDTLRINASNYSPNAADYYGIATAVGNGPSSIVWATGVSDLNPWELEPDDDPLIFDNLMPLGAGSESITTTSRGGDRFYIRAYPIAEAGVQTLTWDTHVAYLDVTIPSPVIASAPATFNATVGNATPGSVIDFSIGADPEVVATGVADDDGFLSVAINLGAVNEGTYLLQARERLTTRVGNSSFIVGSTEYAPPDVPEPPAPPVLSPVPAPVPRWRLQDPTDGTTFEFVINPRTVDSMQLARQLTPSTTTAVHGQAIVFEGGRRARRWSMSGTVLTLADLDALKAWVKPYRLYVTDDLGRHFIVKVLGVKGTPVRDADNPGHHSYVLTALMYGKVPS